MNRRRKFMVTLIVLLIVLSGTLLGFPKVVQADPISVTTPTDELDGYPGNGYCSLREAIANANNDDKGQNDCVSGVETNLIILPDFLFTLTLDGVRLEDGNQTGDLDITGELTISGMGATETLIQAGTSSPLSGTCVNCIDRVFHILLGAEVTLRNLTIQYGQAPMATATESAESGGGIKNQGDLTLNAVNVTYNHAGDGWDNDSGPGGFGGNGGGIQNLGLLTVINSWITHNHAGAGGDALAIAQDYGGYGGYGGGIYSGGDSSILLTNSILQLNKAGNGSRGSDNDAGDGAFGGDGGKGGAILCGNCQLTMLNSSLIQNYSGTGGSGGSSWGGGGSGGAGGLGGHGGGVFLEGSDASANVAACRIHNNEAGNGGYSGEDSVTNKVGTPNLRGSGGGLYVEDDAQLNITGSTISENYGYKGGGINNILGGDVTLYNCTVSGNMSDYDGGGLYVDDPATLETTFVTITGNITDYEYNGGGTGGGFFAYGAFTMTNTIVAGNFDWSGFDNFDCRGYTVSLDYNIIGVADSDYCYASSQSHDQFGTGDSPIDPLLGVLAYNGGRTQTHALSPASPAVDIIPTGVNGCISGTTKDQRGVIRYGYCDLGAYEIDIAKYIYVPLILR